MTLIQTLASVFIPQLLCRVVVISLKEFAAKRLPSCNEVRMRVSRYIFDWLAS